MFSYQTGCPVWKYLLNPSGMLPVGVGRKQNGKRKNTQLNRIPELKFFLPTIQPPISSSLVFQFYQWGADREGKLPEKLAPLTVWTTVTALCPSAPPPPLDGFGV